MYICIFIIFTCLNILLKQQFLLGIITTRYLLDEDLIYFNKSNLFITSTKTSTNRLQNFTQYQISMYHTILQL